MSIKSLFSAGLLALVAMVSLPVQAKNIERLKIPDSFDYATQRTLAVAVGVDAPGVSAVSLFAKYGKTPRLLQTGLVAPGANYQATLTLPAAVKVVIVSARYGNKVKKVRVPVRRKQTQIARTISLR